MACMGSFSSLSLIAVGVRLIPEQAVAVHAAIVQSGIISGEHQPNLESLQKFFKPELAGTWAASGALASRTHPSDVQARLDMGARRDDPPQGFH